MLNRSKGFLNKRESVAPQEGDEKRCFEQGFAALCLERPMEAERYWSLLEESDHSAVFFNRSLGFLMVKDYASAYSYLEKALSKLPRNRLTDTIYHDPEKLRRYEEENDAYQRPMLYDTPLRFPDLAREQIIRLMVDILFLLGRKAEMLNKISGLRNKQYKNIKEKI